MTYIPVGPMAEMSALLGALAALTPTLSQGEREHRRRVRVQATMPSRCLRIILATFFMGDSKNRGTD
jgi:hypothetical protein